MKFSNSFKEWIKQPDRVFNTISVFLVGTMFGIILAIHTGIWK